MVGHRCRQNWLLSFAKNSQNILHRILPKCIACFLWMDQPLDTINHFETCYQNLPTTTYSTANYSTERQNLAWHQCTKIGMVAMLRQNCFALEPIFCTIWNNNVFLYRIKHSSRSMLHYSHHQLNKNPHQAFKCHIDNFTNTWYVWIRCIK